MIIFGRIEAGEWLTLGDDRRLEDVCLIKLSEISLGDPLLVVVGEENGRAVRSAAVGALIVQLRRIVSDRKINLKDFAVGNLLRIVCDLDRLGVAGLFSADRLVMRRVLLAAGI